MVLRVILNASMERSPAPMMTRAPASEVPVILALDSPLSQRDPCFFIRRILILTFRQIVFLLSFYLYQECEHQQGLALVV